MGQPLLPLVALASLSLLSLRPAAGLRCLDAPTISCSEQMPHLNLSRDDCVVENYPSNSTECAGLDARGDRWSRRLGVVRLRPFLWMDEEGTPLTALNVSLLDARWARLALRFSALDGSAPTAGACRVVKLSEHAQSLSRSAGRPPQLHWPCPWCGHGCEARPFSLEYSATSGSGAEYGRFLFSVPPHTYVGEPGVPFPYVEVSSLPLARLHWAPPPPPDGASLYSVATLVDGRRVAARTVPAAQQLLELDVGAATGGGGGGAVSFSVRALLPNCSLCADVRTPPLALERSADAPYLWVTAAVVALAGAILLLGRCLWRAAGRNSPPDKQAVSGPRVLLLYQPVSPAHMSVVRRLANYLRSAGCRVLLDDDDIPRCANKDPLCWYSSQMVGADVALVVASPCTPAAPSAAPAAGGVYGPAAAAALSLLGARLSRGGRCEALALPCCHRRPRCRCRPRLPPPARGLRLLRARRPSDLRRLLRRLHAGGPTPRSAPSDAAASELLRVARESAGSCLCLQQEDTEEAADESSDVPEPREPDLEAEPEPPAAVVTSPTATAAVSSAFDLHSMNLLGAEEARGEEDEEDGGLLREIRVTAWTADGQPHTVSLQL